MVKDFDELVCDFIDEKGRIMANTMYILNGGKSADDITDDDVNTFLMDCLKEGLEVLVSRAMQMIENEIKKDDQ